MQKIWLFKQKTIFCSNLHPCRSSGCPAYNSLESCGFQLVLNLD